MTFTVDEHAGVLRTTDGDLPLYSAEAFQILSGAWTRTGWALRYSYAFTWMGRPVIQLPEDLLRTQEVIASLRPDLIIETGVAHGGSALFYASLLELMGAGEVLAIDIDIRPHNRAAIEAHPLAHRVHLLQGSSTDPAIVQAAADRARRAERVLILLDSDHSYAHVRAELEAYAPLVTPGSWIVATDGIMRDLEHVPGGRPGWARDNPARAAEDFLAEHPEFEAAPPERLFDETAGLPALTYWPSAWLRRRPQES